MQIEGSYAHQGQFPGAILGLMRLNFLSVTSFLRTKRPMVSSNKWSVSESLIMIFPGALLDVLAELWLAFFTERIATFG